MYESILKEREQKKANPDSKSVSKPIIQNRAIGYTPVIQCSTVGAAFDIARDTAFYNVVGSTDDTDTNPETASMSWIDKWKHKAGVRKKCYARGSVKTSGDNTCNTTYIGGHVVFDAVKAANPGADDVFLLSICGKHNHTSNVARMVTCEDTKGVWLKNYVK